MQCEILYNRNKIGTLKSSVVVYLKTKNFDIFKSKELKDGRRSLAYELEFRSAERTLTDVEVGKTFQRIVEALRSTAGIEVRES